MLPKGSFLMDICKGYRPGNELDEHKAAATQEVLVQEVESRKDIPPPLADGKLNRNLLGTQ